MTARLVQFCQQAGWRWSLQAVHAGRHNLIALIPGARGDVQLWEAHQDTVAIEGARSGAPPARVEGGCVHGRGACDVKGGMAAMLVAITRLAAEPASTRPTI